MKKPILIMTTALSLSLIFTVAGCSNVSSQETWSTGPQAISSGEVNLGPKGGASDTLGGPTAGSLAGQQEAKRLNE